MPADYTAAKRQAQFRQRQREAGMVELRAWVTPNQAEAIWHYLEHGTALPLRDAPIAVLVNFINRPGAASRGKLRQLGLAGGGKTWSGKAQDRTTAEQWAAEARRMGGQVTID